MRGWGGVLQAVVPLGGGGAESTGWGWGQLRAFPASLQGLPQQGLCQSWPTGIPGEVRGFGHKGKPQQGSKQMCLNSGRALRWGLLFPRLPAGFAGLRGDEHGGARLGGRTQLGYSPGASQIWALCCPGCPLLQPVHSSGPKVPVTEAPLLAIEGPPGSSRLSRQLLRGGSAHIRISHIYL